MMHMMQNKRLSLGELSSTQTKKQCTSPMGHGGHAKRTSGSENEEPAGCIVQTCTGNGEADTSVTCDRVKTSTSAACMPGLSSPQRAAAALQKRGRSPQGNAGEHRHNKQKLASSQPEHCTKDLGQAPVAPDKDWHTMFTGLKLDSSTHRSDPVWSAASANRGIPAAARRLPQTTPTANLCALPSGTVHSAAPTTASGTGFLASEFQRIAAAAAPGAACLDDSASNAMQTQ